MSHGQQNSVRLKDVSVHQPIVSSKENATQAYQPAAAVYHPAIPSQMGMQLLNDNHNIASSTLIGQNLWKQLKRVTIPVFSGDKRTYQNWKAAFVTCVDKAPATPEHKLLQL